MYDRLSITALGKHARRQDLKAALMDTLADHPYKYTRNTHGEVLTHTDTCDTIK